MPLPLQIAELKAIALNAPARVNESSRRRRFAKDTRGILQVFDKEQRKQIEVFTRTGTLPILKGAEGRAGSGLPTMLSNLYRSVRELVCPLKQVRMELYVSARWINVGDPLAPSCSVLLKKSVAAPFTTLKSYWSTRR